MKSQTQNTLTTIAVIIMALVLGLFFFITKGNSGIHENLRMNRVAQILEKDPKIINNYGADCSIRRLESGLQSAIVMHMELYHVSRFEVTTISGETLGEMLLE